MSDLIKGKLNIVMHDDGTPSFVMDDSGMLFSFKDADFAATQSLRDEAKCKIKKLCEVIVDAIERYEKEGKA